VSNHAREPTTELRTPDRTVFMRLVAERLHQNTTLLVGVSDDLGYDAVAIGKYVKKLVVGQVGSHPTPLHSQ
jgi:hypothetical protein